MKLILTEGDYERYQNLLQSYRSERDETKRKKIANSLTAMYKAAVAEIKKKGWNTTVPKPPLAN